MEFIDNLMQSILGAIYQGLYKYCEYIFGFFSDLLNISLSLQIENAAVELTKHPEQWDQSAFIFIHDVAKNICIPIAGIVMVFIFTLELIQCTRENNHMVAMKSDKWLMMLGKLVVCLLLCSKSFEIVMEFLNLGIWAAKKMSKITEENLDAELKLSEILPPEPDEYSVFLILQLVGSLLIIVVALIIVYIIGLIIYVRVMLWFLELLIYSSLSPIPFSTLGNKEWSQIGMNYTRKMMAMSFEGFIMMLIFLLYGVIITSVNTSSSFLEVMMKLLGCGIAMILLLGKAGSISASIFNAH